MRGNARENGGPRMGINFGLERRRPLVLVHFPAGVNVHKWIGVPRNECDRDFGDVIAFVRDSPSRADGAAREPHCVPESLRKVVASCSRRAKRVQITKVDERERSTETRNTQLCIR